MLAELCGDGVFGKGHEGIEGPVSFLLELCDEQLDVSEATLKVFSAELLIAKCNPIFIEPLSEVIERAPGERSIKQRVREELRLRWW